MPDPLTLARELRLAAGLTQAALAERAGLDIRTVRRIECGEVEPLQNTALLLATALDCKPSDLRGPGG